MNKKICYITGSFPPVKDGVGDWSYFFINAMAKTYNDSEYTVVTAIPANYNTRYSIMKDWKFCNIDTFSLINVIKIVKLIKEEDFDIIHIEYPCKGYGNSIAINLLPLLIKMTNKKIKIVATFHEYSNYTWKGKFRIRIMDLFADVVFTTDMKNAKVFSKIKNNVRGVLPVPPQVKVNYKSEYNNDCMKFSYWGFIRKNKGLELVITAFEKYHSMNENSALYIMAELSEEDEYHMKIKNMIKASKYEESIHILGYLSEDEVCDELIKTDCCLLPFMDGISLRRGTFSLAFCAGVPVITTISDEPIEFLKNKENICLINYNENELIECMKKMENIEFREKIGINAKKTSRVFSWDKNIEKVYNVYESLVKV